jgi:L-threonylcarbamoyladenylate synthase
MCYITGRSAPSRVSLSILPVPLLAAVDVVRNGGVIVYPTETVYGLGCDPWRSEAVARVREIKGRAAAQPMLAVTHDWEAVERWFAVIPPLLSPLMVREPPLAVTVVMAASDEAPPALVAPDGTIAILRTSDPVAAQLAAASGGAILSTSANRTGEPPPRQLAELHPAIVTAVDVIVDAGAPLAGTPSTIVALRDGRLEILREGAVSEAEIRRMAGCPDAKD